MSHWNRHLLMITALLCVSAGLLLPSSLTAQSPQDLPEAAAPQDPPPPPPPPPPAAPQQNAPPVSEPSTLSICGDKLLVRNATTADLKFLYKWSPHQDPTVFTVKKKTDVHLTPVYCPSHLIILTGDQRSFIDVDPRKSYEITWSSEKKKFLLGLLPTESSRTPE